MITTITTPPRSRTIDLEDLSCELSCFSSLLLALSMSCDNREGYLAHEEAAEAINALHLYIDRVADDIAAFTVGERTGGEAQCRD